MYQRSVKISRESNEYEELMEEKRKEDKGQEIRNDIQKETEENKRKYIIEGKKQDYQENLNQNQYIIYGEFGNENEEKYKEIEDKIKEYIISGNKNKKINEISDTKEKTKKQMNNEENIRIKIEDSELKAVYNELKSKNLSLKKISEEIGVDFKGPLYRNYSMNNNSFNKLKSLLGRDIPHTIKGTNQEEVKDLKRITIEKSTLKSICDDLNEKGISMNEISKNIGTQIGNALRSGYSINEDSFKKLEKLYGSEIPHEIKETKEKINEPIKLKEDEKLAEMTCIILGDGHLHKKGQKSYKNSVLSISLNRIDEKKYVEYVKESMEKMFKVEPDVYPRKDSKGVDLKLYGDGLVDTLVSKGIKTGDKVENQVNVPDWIKKDRPLVVRGLKGLTDTDGSIYVASRNKTININFRNASHPLVKDFKEMCQSLDINAGKISSTEWISQKTGKNLKGYKTQIQAKKDVKNFLEIIKPMKWEIKKQEISEKLKELGISIEEALAYKYKR